MPCYVTGILYASYDNFLDQFSNLTSVWKHTLFFSEKPRLKYEIWSCCIWTVDSQNRGESFFAWLVRTSFPPRSLNRSNVHYPIHSSLLLAPNLNQMDTVHAVTAYFFLTSFNNIFQVVHSSSNWPLRLPTKNSHNFLIASLHALRNPFHPSLVYHCTGRGIGPSPVAGTSTWQYTTLRSDRHPCPLRNSNPQSHQSNGRILLLRPRDLWCRLVFPFRQ